MSAMDCTMGFSDVIGHLEQACEQLVTAVRKLG